MELLLYLAMGVFALLFAVVLYYLITWSARRFSGAPRPTSTADRQPDTEPTQMPGPPTTGRSS